MVIDVHAHVVVREALADMHSAHPDFTHELVDMDDGLYLRRPGRDHLIAVPSALLDIDERLAAMDRQGVDLQVVAIQPRQYHYEVPGDVGADLAKTQNDAMLHLSDLHPDRLHVMLTLPLQNVEASIAELARVGSNKRVRGVQIGANVNGTNLDSPELEPVWAALSAAGLPVLIHPGVSGMAATDRLGSYHLINLIGNPLESTIAIASLIFGGVLERHPSLNFAFVHGGGFAPYQTGRWDHGWRCRSEARENIEIPPTEYFNRLFFDTLTHDQLSLRLLGERVGWGQIVVGSDYPFDMGSDDPVGIVRELGLPAEVTESILSENPENFLRPGPQ